MADEHKLLHHLLSLETEFKGNGRSVFVRTNSLLLPLRCTSLLIVKRSITDWISNIYFLVWQDTYRGVCFSYIFWWFTSKWIVVRYPGTVFDSFLELHKMCWSSNTIHLLVWKHFLWIFVNHLQGICLNWSF